MKNQNGSIQIKHDTWTLRWRETIRENGAEKSVMRRKTLGEVTAEHRRHKDRKTGKLRIPDEIQTAANVIMEPVRTRPPVSVLTTIGEFITDYLKDRKADLKAGVHYNYMRLWKRHLEKRIASKVLRDYKRPDAFGLWKEILKDNPHFSRQTISHIRFFLSGVFNAALNQGMYSGDNPAAADLPTGLRGRSETHAYSEAQVTNMLQLLAGNPQGQALIALAWGSGMGPAELAAFRWDDYEPTDNGANLHIRQSYYHGVISTPKTENRANDAKIGPEVCAFVEAYREHIGKPKTGLMFCYSATRPINLQSFAKWNFHKRFKDAGIPWAVKEQKGWGWYAFRRGTATFTAKQLGGKGVKAASIMLRHGDENVTKEHYILNTKQDRRALEARKQVDKDELLETVAATIGKAIGRVN